MLKLLMRYCYKDQVYVDEKELFYEIYKWVCGLEIVISLRRIIYMIICMIVAIAFLFLGVSKLLIISCYILLEFLLFLWIRQEQKKQARFNMAGMRTPSQIRAFFIEEWIRKYISKKGKALGKKEWKMIKESDIGLYNDLLCEECNHCCYFYSLEIAKIIKDSILIWGAIEDPFENTKKYYAHAFILRNGYIYDSNMRQSIKYEDFVKIFNFKLYKEWSYEDYSIDRFRDKERSNFRNWCKKNNVFAYEIF